jgi:hypothetical protein
MKRIYNFLNVKALSLVFSFVFLTGCATLLDGTSQKLTFSSSPSGATVKINDQKVGETPLTINRVREDQALRVEISKPGYQTATRTISSKFNNRVISNIGGGTYGLTSAGVDFLNRNPLYQYKPSGVHASLQPQQASLQQRKKFQERERLRKFILTAYPSLMTQIKQKKGPYLDTLVNQLDTDDGTVVEKVQESLQNARNRVHFAELVLEEFNLT